MSKKRKDKEKYMPKENKGGEPGVEQGVESEHIGNEKEAAVSELKRVADFLADKNVVEDFNEIEEMLDETYQAFD